MDETSRTERIDVEPDIRLEVDESGELSKIEFLSPELVTPEAVNRALVAHGFDPIDAADLSPLRIGSWAHTDTKLRATFEKGRLGAAYLTLAERPQKYGGSRRVTDEIIIDFNREGDLIGIELLAPVSYVDVHLILMENGLKPLNHSELWPVLLD